MIARLAGIQSEEKELKEGGGEDRVDSSESDEPKVKLKNRIWIQPRPYQVGPGMDLFPGEGKKGFRLRKGHKEERVGGKVEFDSKKVSHSVSATI